MVVDKVWRRAGVWGIAVALAAGTGLADMMMAPQAEEIEAIMRLLDGGDIVREEAIRALEAVANGYREVAEDEAPPPGRRWWVDDVHDFMTPSAATLCCSVLVKLGEFKGEEVLSFLEEMSLSSCGRIRSVGINGYIGVAGAVDALAFIDRMGGDARYTERDRMDAYNRLAGFFMDYAAWKREEERWGRRISPTPPYPELSSEEQARVFAFMLGKVRAEANADVVAKLDEALVRLLPGYERPEKARRAQEAAAAVRDEYDQAHLAWLAKNAPDREARRQAVLRLTDQTALVNIAKDEACTLALRWAAVYRLTDHALLAEIAQSDMDMTLRREAVSKLSDQALLAKIARDNRAGVDMEQERRFAAPPSLCVLAVTLLTDPTLLAEFSHEDGDYAPIRSKAVYALTDQTLLAAFAKHDPHPWVRRSALARLADPSLLAECAQDGTIPAIVRHAAVRNPNLTDQALLEKIALGETNDNDEDDRWVREAATAKLTNQTLLAELAKNSSEDGMRRAAIAGLTDQALLAHIAQNDENGWVRHTAMDKVTDQAVLAAIVRNDEDVEMRREAMRRLTDQALLAELAENDEHDWVRSDALWLLEDQAIIERIARSNKNERIRIRAIGRLTDPMLLNEFHTNAMLSDSERHAAGEQIYWTVSTLRDTTRLRELVDTGGGKVHGEAKARLRWLEARAAPAHVTAEERAAMARRAALFTLDDPARIADIARHDPDAWTRQKAVYKLNDSALLGDIATGDSDRFVQLAALCKLHDSTVVAEAAKGSPCPILRSVAAGKLDAQALLAEVAKTDESHDVRMRAAAKLHDPLLLADIARNSADSTVVVAIIGRLDDQALFADLVTGEKHHETKSAAWEKLTDDALLMGIATNCPKAGVRQTAVLKLVPPFFRAKEALLFHL